MVMEDDLYLGARERRGEIEKEREEREGGVSRTVTNFYYSRN